MNKPHVIRNVLSQEERISLWDYFDRRSPSMNSLATWTFNNASYGQGDPVSVSYTHLTLPTILPV